MSSKKTFSILFRKYPFFRALSYVIVIALALGALSMATLKSKRAPVILSVIPVVGSPGDMMTIRGSNFGPARGTSFVEIGGNRITASGYITWTDSLITLTIPSNVQDGLVAVVTKSGRSKPGFFANEAGIPVAVQKSIGNAGPSIVSIAPQKASCGSLITITGNDFGTARGGGKVFFASNSDETSPDFDFSVISASDADFDYEYWSDSEIRVRIPDGAGTGGVYVKTEKGKSNSMTEEISLPIGNKTYHSRKTYILQTNEDFDPVDTKKRVPLTLRIPRPLVVSWQPMVELTECVPEPVIPDYKNTVIHQIELQKAGSKNEKIRLSHNFVVSSYAVRTEINEKAVRPYSAAALSRPLFKASVSADPLIHSDDERVREMAEKITGGEKNPYTQARLIYEHLVQNYNLRGSMRKSDDSPLDLLRSKRGDAYDMAIFYTTLLRSLRIPAEPIAGILVDSEMKSRAHWWTEFYLEGLGWVPADISLGMGMSYNSFKPVDSPAEFYFGNLDSQHIAFSKGWNEIKQTISSNSKIVYRPRTYALQSIWEESGDENVNYSSLWNDPVVLGLY